MPETYDDSHKAFPIDLAAMLVENQMGKHMTWQTDPETGTESFTEDAQDLFMVYSDSIEHHIEALSLKISHKSKGTSDTKALQQLTAEVTREVVEVRLGVTRTWQDNLCEEMTQEASELQEELSESILSFTANQNFAITQNQTKSRKL